MISTSKLARCAALATGLTIGAVAVSTTSGAAEGSKSASFTKRANAVCQSANEAANMYAAHLNSSDVTTDKAVLTEEAGVLGRTATDLKAIKPPKADATDYTRGIAQLRAFSSATKRFAEESLHLTSKEYRSFMSSAKKASVDGTTDFGSIGLSACVAAVAWTTSAAPAASTSTRRPASTSTWELTTTGTSSTGSGFGQYSSTTSVTVMAGTGSGTWSTTTDSATLSTATGFATSWTT